MDGIDWGGSAMSAARSRLDIATVNLANASTDGFRKLVARGSLTANGVRIDSRTAPQSGVLKRTGRDEDLAIVGRGSFRVRDGNGSVSTTRDGAFVRERDGSLRDDRGRVLLGLHGPLRVPAGARIDDRGRVLAAGRQVDRIPLEPGASLHTGYLEASNVDAIAEMVDVMTAQRSFETAEKIVAAIDGTRQKASNDLARLK